jgi:hypothetical protein
VLPLARDQLVLDQIAHLVVEGRQGGLILGEAALLGPEKLMKRHGVAEEGEGAPGSRLGGHDSSEGVNAPLQSRHGPLVGSSKTSDLLESVAEPAVQRAKGMLVGEDRGELGSEECVEALGLLLLAHDVSLPRARAALARSGW